MFFNEVLKLVKILLRTEADIRKKRQQMIYAQEERRRQILEVIGIIILVLIIGGSAIGLTWLIVNARGM